MLNNLKRPAIILLAVTAAIGAAAIKYAGDIVDAGQSRINDARMADFQTELQQNSSALVLYSQIKDRNLTPAAFQDFYIPLDESEDLRDGRKVYDRIVSFGDEATKIMKAGIENTSVLDNARLNVAGHALKSFRGKSLSLPVEGSTVTDQEDSTAQAVAVWLATDSFVAASPVAMGPPSMRVSQKMLMIAEKRLGVDPDDVAAFEKVVGPEAGKLTGAFFELRGIELVVMSKGTKDHQGLVDMFAPAEVDLTDAERSFVSISIGEAKLLANERRHKHPNNNLAI